VNAWFDRLREALVADLGDPGLDAPLRLEPADADALLELAREAAHGSGARQYAPLATYLAGRLVQARGAGPEERRALFAAVARAVAAAGAAGGGAAAG